jgi:hypothetical protein
MIGGFRRGFIRAKRRAKRQALNVRQDRRPESSWRRVDQPYQGIESEKARGTSHGRQDPPFSGNKARQRLSLERVRRGCYVVEARRRMGWLLP